MEYMEEVERTGIRRVLLQLRGSPNHSSLGESVRAEKRQPDTPVGGKREDTRMDEGEIRN